MKNDWVDFRAVKASISMEMTLAHYGVMLHRLDAHYLRGRCPLPTHASKSSRQSFIVNTEKNAWACHSDSCAAARGGCVGGNVLDFVAFMESCSIQIGIAAGRASLSIPRRTRGHATPTRAPRREAVAWAATSWISSHSWKAVLSVMRPSGFRTGS